MCSQEVEAVKFSGLRISSLLFADVVLVVESSNDLQLAVEQFAAECEVAEKWCVHHYT